MLVATFLLVAFGAPVTAGQRPPVPREILADAVTSPSPPPRRAPAADAADSKAPSRPPSQAEALPPRSRPIARDEDLDQRPVRNPVWGFMFRVWIRWRRRRSGQGLAERRQHPDLERGRRGRRFAGGVMWTPLWLGDALGLGVSGTFGYKGWSVGGSDGDISIGRFPITAAVHVLPRIARNWIAVGAGWSRQRDRRLPISSSGAASGIGASLDAKLGRVRRGRLLLHVRHPQESGGARRTAPCRRQHGAFSPDVPLREADRVHTANGYPSMAKV